MLNGELRSPEGDGEGCPVYHPGTQIDQNQVDKRAERQRARARRREDLFSSLLLEWRRQDR